MIFGVSILSIALRFARGAVVAVATYWWQHHSGFNLNDFVTHAAGTGAAGGTAMAAAKFLRDKFPGWFEWLPV